MTRHRRFPIARAASLLVVAALAAAPEQALAGDDPIPLGDGVPSFNESPGCDALDGIRGPTAADPGRIELWEPIYGPWADFYGRTMADAWAQRVVVQLPGMSPGTKALFIHERVLPAFEQVVENLNAEAAVGNRYTAYDSQTWSWASYTIPPKRHFSFHAVGAAIDVNSRQNPYRADNVLITTIPDWYAQAWRDAGWCWGGDWQTIKDPMHFAWKGPLFTPGYEMPPPQPPLVGAAAFTAQVDLAVGLTPATGSPHVVADVDRDGAVDVVRMQTAADGHIDLVTAAARYAFSRPQILARTTTPPTDAAAPVDLADLTRDGRPDLVYLLDDAGALAFQVFPWVQSGLLGPQDRSTVVPFDPGAMHRFADLDRDGHTDLFVISPGDPARLTVWPGPDFATTAIDVELAVPVTGYRFDTGDRDVDGIPDLFALADDGTMVIHTGASGFVSTTTVTTGVTGDEAMFVTDLDGDGHSDLMLVSPDGATRLRRGGASSHDPGVWYVVKEIDVGGSLGCITSPFVVGADGDSVGLVDPATGIWCLRGDAGELRSFYYGNRGDYPFMGDWDCDGIDTPGLYRQTDGYVYLRNSNTQGVADVRFYFGNPGDVPMVGDFDGDGCDTVSLYRPSLGRFYIINELGSGDTGLGAADFEFDFGNRGDKPFVADFDGDDIDTIGVHRASTGTVYYKNSHGPGAADASFAFGNTGDLVVAGDWNGDNDDSPGVFRPSARSFLLRHLNTAGPFDRSFPMGEPTWLPVAGRFGP